VVISGSEDLARAGQPHRIAVGSLERFQAIRQQRPGTRSSNSYHKLGALEAFRHPARKVATAGSFQTSLITSKIMANLHKIDAQKPQPMRERQSLHKTILTR
jgi:hypothetical protein